MAFHLSGHKPDPWRRLLVQGTTKIAICSKFFYISGLARRLPLIGIAPRRSEETYARGARTHPTRVFGSYSYNDRAPIAERWSGFYLYAED
jgi:hypothetical protein